MRWGDPRSDGRILSTLSCPLSTEMCGWLEPANSTMAFDNRERCFTKLSPITTGVHSLHTPCCNCDIQCKVLSRATYCSAHLPAFLQTMSGQRHVPRDFQNVQTYLRYCTLDGNSPFICFLLGVLSTHCQFSFVHTFKDIPRQVSFCPVFKDIFRVLFI